MSFYIDNADKKITNFPHVVQLVKGLFHEHTIMLNILKDDEEQAAEVTKIVNNGTWGDLNEWILNNF